MTHAIPRRVLFDIWVENPKSSKLDALMAFVLHELENVGHSDNSVQYLKSKLKNFCQKVSCKWEKVGRHRQRFLDANSSWIQENIIFDEEFFQDDKNTAQVANGRPGRPKKPFSECSYKTRASKVQNLVKAVSTDELSLATEIKLRQEGKRDSAALIKELSSASPKRGTTIKKARLSVQQKPASLSTEEALALIVDTNLSTCQYTKIRNQAENLNCKLYPPYYRVREAKKQCYPEGIVVTETTAEIPLQSVINHTISRLCKIEEVKNKIGILQNPNFSIIIKWGCDGSEQNRYKQRFFESPKNCSDESLFSISMVPLEMYCGQDEHKNVIWKNPVSSSTKYCRPISFHFAKETANFIVTEVEKMNHQINNLIPTRISVEEFEINVKSILVFCMVDGKVCNAVSSCPSTQTCYLCGAKPKEMNHLSKISRKEVKSEFLAFGISPLHAWIRLLECILHISYRLEIKTWQAKGPENKEKVARKKREVQDKFRSELGLLLDMPKQQAGNTNDGNSARRFFRNPEKASEITGINFDLIRRLGLILECINSKEKVNLDRFEILSKEILHLYLDHYSWYPMPVSLHKILFHGRQILETCILPIGQYSEEAQEARNKHNRQYRELFTRKTSRIDTNRDLLNRLLITLDPYISSFRVCSKNRSRQMNEDLMNLLEVDKPKATKQDLINLSASPSEAEDSSDYSDSSD